MRFSSLECLVSVALARLRLGTGHLDFVEYVVVLRKLGDEAGRWVKHLGNTIGFLRQLHHDVEL